MSCASVSLMHQLWLVRGVLAFPENPRPFIKRMASNQSKNKPAQHDGAKGEDRVTEHPHPSEIRQYRCMEKFGRTRIPGPDLDRCPRLRETYRQRTE